MGGTATGGSDFLISGHRGQDKVEIPAGAKTATIPVTLIDDSVQEGSETVILTIEYNWSYVTGFHNTHTVTIVDNETPTVSFASASQSAGEGSGTHDVEVTLGPAPTTDVTFTYTVGGTATAGSDFTIAHSGTVTVPKGATTALIPVTFIDDTEGESGETVVLKLSGNAGYKVASPGTHTLTIADNEPVLSFASASQSAGEGSGTRNVGVTLSPAPTTDVTVTYTVGGTATAGSDFTVANSGTVTVPAGATTATIPVTLIDDTEGESGETVVLKLTGNAGYRVGSPGTHTLTIADNEPRVSFAPASQSAGEGSGTNNVGVTLNRAPTTDLTLTYTVGGTAAAGSDFTIANSGTVTVAKGATTALIPVTLIDDSVQEGSETVVLKFTGSAGYKVGSPGAHTLTIAANDEPMVSFPEWGLQELEWSGTHDVKLTLDPAQAVDLTLTYKVSGTATPDEDYTALPGTLLVPAGATTAVIPVTIIDDTHEDNGESVVLTLVEGPGYKVRSDRIEHFRMFRFHILNDDVDEPAVTIAAGTSLVTEGAGAAFTLTADPAPSADLPVTVTVAADGDYGVSAGSRTVTIPTTGSATLTLATTGDDADEPHGSVTVTVIDGNGYTVGASASDSVTVRDDDEAPGAPDWTDYQTVVSYLVEVRDNPENTAVKGNPVHIAKWNRVLEAVGHNTGTGLAPMAASEIHAKAAQWPDSPFRAASVYLTSLDDTDPDEPPDTPAVTPPAVTVSADAASVTEGGSATFTLTADPAPASSLSVSVTVAAAGDYGVTAGSQTVTIPTTGSATLTLATTGDNTDEPDGSVTATVTDGSGYTVGDPASGTVALRDDDVPVVTIAADAASVTEGGTAVFTLTASPAPAAALPVSVAVATVGEYGITAGTQTVTLPTTGSATLTLATTDDTTDEPDGSVSVTVQTGSGYTVGTPASGTVAVRDDDLPPPVVTIAAKAASVTEGGDAVFTLTADRAPLRP